MLVCFPLWKIVAGANHKGLFRNSPLLLFPLKSSDGIIHGTVSGLPDAADVLPLVSAVATSVSVNGSGGALGSCGYGGALALDRPSAGIGGDGEGARCTRSAAEASRGAVDIDCFRGIGGLVLHVDAEAGDCLACEIDSAAEISS